MRFLKQDLIVLIIWLWNIYESQFVEN